MAATLELDTTQVDEALAKVKALDASVRGIGQGGGAGIGGGGGGAAETGKSFRQWDTELRHVEHTGRGLLALLGVGGGILGVAHLMTRELQEWHATLEKISKGETDLGGKIAAAAAKSAPGFVQSELKRRKGEFMAAGIGPGEAAGMIADPGAGAERGMNARREMQELKAAAARGEPWAVAQLQARAGSTVKEWGEFQAYIPFQAEQQVNAIGRERRKIATEEYERESGGRWRSGRAREYVKQSAAGNLSGVYGDAIPVVIVGDSSATDSGHGN